MDIQRSLRTVLATGKVLVGSDQSLKAVGRGEAKLVIAAENAPAASELQEASVAKGVAFYTFPGMGTELGPACGKPFAIAALAVLDPGQSDIMQLAG